MNGFLQPSLFHLGSGQGSDPGGAGYRVFLHHHHSFIDPADILFSDHHRWRTHGIDRARGEQNNPVRILRGQV
ncbi:MAG: hypothetical protein FJ117_13340 [Deltaproteobacteria bacterium]|nr:hypothetical protein [Deltaproteobacteria bacterium]